MLPMTGSRRGYADPLYAQALAEFGEVRPLAASGGWVLMRAVGDSGLHDAMGGYPLFACRDWSALAADLEELADEAVSLALVADPFQALEPERLRVLFPDLVLPFKEHFVVDLSQPPESFVAAHHRRNARQALQIVQVEMGASPQAVLDDWVRLYDVLIKRHGITGMRAFSRQSFAAQLQVPGMVVQRALADGEVVGMVLWLVAGDVAYYHLGAYTERGYRLKASFALFDRALAMFADQVRWLGLGAGAGLDPSADDGLTRFKRGWATGTRTAYFCGRIFDRPAYDRLSAAVGNQQRPYFPAYRAGEFA